MLAEEYFYNEYNKWREETMLLSTGIFDNEHFENIVKMGKDAAIFLLNVLMEGPNHIVHACDLIYPDEVTYEGYIPLEMVCQVWCHILKEKLREDALSKQTNNS